MAFLEAIDRVRSVGGKVFRGEYGPALPLTRAYRRSVKESDDYDGYKLQTKLDRRAKFGWAGGTLLVANALLGPILPFHVEKVLNIFAENPLIERLQANPNAEWGIEFLVGLGILVLATRRAAQAENVH